MYVYVYGVNIAVKVRLGLIWGSTLFYFVEVFPVFHAFRIKQFHITPVYRRISAQCDVTVHRLNISISKAIIEFNVQSFLTASSPISQAYFKLKCTDKIYARMYFYYVLPVHPFYLQIIQMYVLSKFACN